MPHDVFISYAAEDKDVADAICKSLESNGIKCWYAPRDVPYAQDFEESIVDAICASRLVILIVSSHSNSSTHVKREIQNACMEEARVPVLPFRVEDVPLTKSMRYYIGAVHWLDAVTPPLDSHLQRLVEHVRPRLPPTSEPRASREPEVREQIYLNELAAEHGAPQHEVPKRPDTGRVEPTGQIQASPPLTPPPIPDPPKIRNYLVPAILSVFCCWPAAIPAIIFAAQVNGKAATWDIQGAMLASKRAKTFSFIGIALGTLFWIVYVLAAVLGR